MSHQIFSDLPTWRSLGSFRDLAHLKQQLDRILDIGDRSAGFHQSGIFPAINLSEDGHQYYIRSELPGVGTDDIDIVVTGNSISIAGERKIPMEEDARYHRRERESGKFSRAVSLPEEIDVSTISATLINGILTLTVPKAEKEKSRQIKVG